MDPHGCNPQPSSNGSSCVSRVFIVTADFYRDFVPKEDQVTMIALETKIKLVREFKDDEEVEE
jgi:hypothetical protein